MTPRPEQLEHSVWLFFWFGIFAVVVIPVAMIFYIHWTFGFEGDMATPLIWGALAMVFATITAVQTRRTYRISIAILVITVFLTGWYLHQLVQLTGGSKDSVFSHLYLYFPAVVLLISHKNWRAEAGTSAMMFISFIFNYENHRTCNAWNKFEEHVTYFRLFECLFIAVLLGLLFAVNKLIERHTESTPTG